jgi:hypothetical protein
MLWRSINDAAAEGRKPATDKPAMTVDDRLDNSKN